MLFSGASEIAPPNLPDTFYHNSLLNPFLGFIQTVATFPLLLPPTKITFQKGMLYVFLVHRVSPQSSKVPGT